MAGGGSAAGGRLELGNTELGKTPSYLISTTRVGSNVGNMGSPTKSTDFAFLPTGLHEQYYAGLGRGRRGKPTPTCTLISPQSRLCLSSTILVRRLPDWGLTFYIRVDREGDFHTYPHLGGPFQSLQEANIAIDCHLDDRKDKKM